MKNFKKITEEDFYNEDFKLEKFVDSKIEHMIKNSTKDYENFMIETMINCESPIEQLLAIEIYRSGLHNIYKFNPFIDVVAIENQAEIICDNNNYRVDFLIVVDYKQQEQKFFVIECDGYEFHQKTKEQVIRDNERHRNLQKNGYEIIRFSGSEIWKSPYKCAREILNIILSNCKYNV